MKDEDNFKTEVGEKKEGDTVSGKKRREWETSRVRRRAMLASSCLCFCLIFFYVSVGSVVLLFPSLTSAVRTHSHTHRIYTHIQAALTHMHTGKETSTHWITSVNPVKRTSGIWLLSDTHARWGKKKNMKEGRKEEMGKERKKEERKKERKNEKKNEKKKERKTNQTKGFMVYSGLINDCHAMKFTQCVYVCVLSHFSNTPFVSQPTHTSLHSLSLYPSFSVLTQPCN